MHNMIDYLSNTELILFLLIALILLYKIDTIFSIIIKILKKYIKKNSTNIELKKEIEYISKQDSLYVIILFASLIIPILYIHMGHEYLEMFCIVIGMTMGLLFRVLFMDTKVTAEEFLTYLAIVTIIIAIPIYILLINFNFISTLNENTNHWIYIILFFSSFLISIFCGIVNIAKKSTFIIEDDRIYYWFLIIIGLIGIIYIYIYIYIYSF